jgi:hypothetical protein
LVLIAARRPSPSGRPGSGYGPATSQSSHRDRTRIKTGPPGRARS